MPEDYVRIALERQVRILALTDHNAVDAVPAFEAAAAGTQLVILPGVELSTNDGHLLAVFGPGHLESAAELLKEADVRTSQDGIERTVRSMLDLIGRIDALGGLAIPAHVDAPDGVTNLMRPAELEQLLCHPGLAALEFRDVANLHWFSDSDENENRRRAWRKRCQITSLADRGLGRVVSSDAHSAERVGIDTSRRTLTRLRLDEPNFAAICNAVKWNPRGRCRPEADLPETYPRVTRLTVEGGFLDGLDLELSPNLTAFIGGRGSGKSTALLAIRAALAAPLRGDDPDEAGRMPDRVTVEFVDVFGSTRRAARERGEAPCDIENGEPIDLPLADLGQDEAGRIARGYGTDPQELLDFLEGFCDLAEFDEREAALIDELEVNAGEVLRTRPDVRRKAQLITEAGNLSAKINSASAGKVEVVAKYAALLASEEPLLAELDQAMERATRIALGPGPDLDSLAQVFQVDLAERPAADHAEALREALADFSRASAGAVHDLGERLESAVAPARAILEEWRAKHDEWRGVLEKRRQELTDAGFAVQAGELDRIGKRLSAIRSELNVIAGREGEHAAAYRKREELLDSLRANRQGRRKARKHALQDIRDAVNREVDGFALHIRFIENGLCAPWIEWLRANFGLRSPRVERAALELPPDIILEALASGRDGIGALSLADGRPLIEPDNVDDAVRAASPLQTRFLLETMRLRDRPVIEIQEAGEAHRRAFDHLSAGQQRSLLLSMVLCADRNEPLVLDQPEDHLDAGYIARSVVRQLERVKERRQVIIATHSANLTVLGDAELVVPMYVENGRAAPRGLGGADHAETRERVCALLEGGQDAYRKRGERYGVRFM